jgi:hypothetical protein
MPRALAALFLLAFVAQAGEIKLVWPPNPDSSVTNFSLWYGTQSGFYTVRQDVGITTNFTLSGFATNVPWYITLTAQNSFGESDFSTELVAQATDPIPAPLPKTNVVTSIFWATDPAGPWTLVLSATNLVTNAFGFYKTTILVTNTP